MYELKLTNPKRIEVRNEDNQWLGTFTLDSYTVTTTGPERTFTEKDVEVNHSIWVRTLPQPFDGTVDYTWLAKALDANQQEVADILAMAMQYIKGAPPLVLDGLQIGGDASYGPIKDGKRQENADFNDYLGIDWHYPNEDPPIDKPEKKEFRCLDCSGYIRMIWGYRHNFAGSGYIDRIPLSRRITSDLSAIPRRSWEICDAGPGIIIIPNRDRQVTDLTQMEIGDLVFFDADTEDGNRIDHLGMYIGIDRKGQHRFISSRKSLNGPTFRDNDKGKSVLDECIYGRRFRAVRRL